MRVSVFFGNVCICQGVCVCVYVCVSHGSLRGGVCVSCGQFLSDCQPVPHGDSAALLSLSSRTVFFETLHISLCAVKFGNQS